MFIEHYRMFAFLDFVLNVTLAVNSSYCTRSCCVIVDADGNVYSLLTDSLCKASSSAPRRKGNSPLLHICTVYFGLVLQIHYVYLYAVTKSVCKIPVNIYGGVPIPRLFYVELRLGRVCRGGGECGSSYLQLCPPIRIAGQSRTTPSQQAGAPICRFPDMKVDSAHAASPISARATPPTDGAPG